MRTPEDTQRDTEIRGRLTEPTRELFAIAIDANRPMKERIAAQDELSVRAYHGEGEARQALSLEGLPE